MTSTARDVLRFYLNRELSRLSGDSRSHDRGAIDALNSAIGEIDELLESLKAVISVADRKTDEFDRAKAAIAKAEGRADV